MPKHQNALIFNDADLAANRAGHLTDGQRKVFQAWSDKNEKSTTFLRTGGGIMGSLCIAVAVLFNNPSLFLVGSWLLSLYTIVSVVQHRGLEKLHHDLEEGVVLTVEGIRNPSARRFRFRRAGEFTIGTTEVCFINLKQYLMLQWGEAYRVFYLPRTKYVVSIESPE
jgi:hypothetical protein